MNEATTVAKLYHFDTDHDRLFRKASSTPSRAETRTMARQKFTSVTEQKQLNRRDAGISWKKW